jgi:hypothetical protein
MKLRSITSSVILVASLLAPAAAFAGYEGAIAFSQDTGAYGWAKNFDNKRGASRSALRNCDADDCKVVYTFTNSCAALAVGNGGGYGVDWDVRQGRAERKAIRACKDYGNRNCRVEVSVCSQNR